MKLHGTVGPARATVSAIAKEAGVQRATVYRHFPDDETLFDACTAHFYALHPLPDLEAWGRIADPGERLRTALTELYAWYGETEEMLANTQRDAAHVPQRTRERFLAYFAAAHRTLMRGRPERGKARRRVAAAVAHGTSFYTWSSLVPQGGLTDADAVELMARMVAAAGV